MSCVAVHHIRPPLLRRLFSTRLRVKVTQTQTHLDPSSSCISLSPLTHPPLVPSLDTHNLPSFILQSSKTSKHHRSPVSCSLCWQFKLSLHLQNTSFVHSLSSIHPFCSIFTRLKQAQAQAQGSGIQRIQKKHSTPRYTICNAQHPVSISIPFNRLSTIMIIQVDTDISLSPSLASFARSLRLVSSSPFHSVVIGRWPFQTRSRRLLTVRHPASSRVIPPPVALSQMHSASTLKLALGLNLKFDPWRLEDGTLQLNVAHWIWSRIGIRNQNQGMGKLDAVWGWAGDSWGKEGKGRRENGDVGQL